MATPRRKCGCGKFLRNSQDTSCAKCKGRLTRAVKTQMKKALGVRPVRRGNIAALLTNNMITQMVDAMVTPPVESKQEKPQAPTRPPGIYKVPRNGDIPAGEIGVV